MSDLIRQVSSLDTSKYTDSTNDASLNVGYQSFSKISEKFADIGKKTQKSVNGTNDPCDKDLNLDILDEMEQKYQDENELITTVFSGEERQKYLDNLDQTYRFAFQQNVIDPLKKIYDEKLAYYKPNQIEILKTMQLLADNPEIIQASIDHELTIHAIEEHHYNALTKGLKKFYDLVYNHSSWHDSSLIKSILTDTINVYSQHRQSKFDLGDLSRYKIYAQTASQKSSSRYEEVLDHMTVTSSGHFYLDFNAIDNADELLHNELKMISAYRYGNDENTTTTEGGK